MLCKTGYLRTTLGVCVLPEDYFTDSCENNNIDGSIFESNKICNYCKEFAIF